jgi:plastocyanin
MVADCFGRVPGDERGPVGKLARMIVRELLRRASIASVLVLLPLAACSGDAPEPRECTDPVPLETVSVRDFAFDPDCLSAPAGASFRVENVGDAPHTFTVEGTDVDLDVSAGSSAESSLSGVEPGRYAVVCRLHPQMEATLTVEAQ